MAVYTSRKPFDKSTIEAVQLKKDNFQELVDFTGGKVSDFQLMKKENRQTCSCFLHYNESFCAKVNENDFVIKKDGGFFHVKEYYFREKWTLPS